MRFTVTCLGSDPLSVREMLKRFANEQWLPAHAAPEQAVMIVFDQQPADNCTVDGTPRD